MFGLDGKMLIKIEDSVMILSTTNEKYAINSEILQRVLNGFNIDMTVPCTLYK